MRTLATLLLGCFVYWQGIAQIQRIEYFIDEQVYFGLGVTVDLPPGTSNEVEFTPTFNFSSLTPGPHQLYIRVMDANGNWGLTFNRTFIVPGGASDQALDGFEYFIDSIGRTGTSTYQKFEDGNGTVNFNDTLRFDKLPPGTHHLYLRVKSTAGIWSSYLTRLFIVPGGSSAQALEGFEYFIDSIARTGSTTFQKFENGNGLVSFNDTLRFDHLPAGTHHLYFRIRSTAGIHTPYLSRMFVTPGGSVNEPLDGFEYFIDSLYGTRKPVYVKFSSNETKIDYAYFIQLEQLKIGLHQMYVRLKNTAGYWSTPFNARFAVLNYEMASKISGLRFFVVDTLGNKSKVFEQKLATAASEINLNPLQIPVETGLFNSGKKYYFHLALFDEKNKTSFFVVDSLRIQASTGIDELQKSSAGLKISPNPVVNEFLVGLSEKMIGPLVLEIIDISGKTQKLYILAGVSDFKLNVSDLKSGLYYLKASDAKGKVSGGKFIKF